MDTMFFRWRLLLLATVLSPTTGFDILTKITCPLVSLKESLDTCTPRDEQPVYIFLPPSLTSPSGNVGVETFVSATGVDYQQMFLQQNIYKCERQQVRKQESQVDCRYARMMACVPWGYQSYLPDKARIKEGLQYLCGHLLSVKPGCDTSKLTEVNSCVKEKDRAVYSEDEDFTEEDRMCRTYEYARDCVANSLSQCRQENVDLYLRVMDYLRPQFCGADAHVTSLVAILFFTGFVQIVHKMLI